MLSIFPDRPSAISSRLSVRIFCGALKFTGQGGGLLTRRFAEGSKCDRSAYKDQLATAEFNLELTGAINARRSGANFFDLTGGDTVLFSTEAGRIECI